MEKRDKVRSPNSPERLRLNLVQAEIGPTAVRSGNGPYIFFHMLVRGMVPTYFIISPFGKRALLIDYYFTLSLFILNYLLLSYFIFQPTKLKGRFLISMSIGFDIKNRSSLDHINSTNFKNI